MLAHVQHLVIAFDMFVVSAHNLAHPLGRIEWLIHQGDQPVVHVRRKGIIQTVRPETELLRHRLQLGAFPYIHNITPLLKGLRPSA